MVLQLNEYEEVINGYSKNHWQPLIDLIREIEASKAFGKEHIVEKSPFPFFENGEIVDKFEFVAADLNLMINFDWMKWDEGRKMYEDETFDYRTLDLPTLCKMITAVIRSDRFMEGALAAAFQSGRIIKILNAIADKVR